MCFAPQRRALFRHRNFQKSSDTEVFCTFWLRNVLRATTACTFSTSQLPKVVRRWGVLYILTSKCASRHNGVHFFNISTTKSGVFCTFWLGNVLRATTACTFSTLQLPKVVRQWCVLYIFTWKCASRHNGVQFFISPLASWLRTRRFSEPTFRPSGATNHWKNTVNRDFPTFSRISIFFLLTLSLLLFSLLIFLFSLPLPCSAFHVSILSEVWLLNFLRLGKSKVEQRRVESTYTFLLDEVSRDASFSQLQLAIFGGPLTRQLWFPHFNVPFLKDFERALARILFWKDIGSSRCLPQCCPVLRLRAVRWQVFGSFWRLWTRKKGFKIILWLRWCGDPVLGTRFAVWQLLRQGDLRVAAEMSRERDEQKIANMWKR